MVDPNDDDGSSDEPFPSEFRCTVSPDGTFQLPARLVCEVGFESPSWDPIQSARVGWYYHEGENKAVLAPEEINRPSLETVTSSALSGVRNEDLGTDEVAGARVTIVSDLPGSLSERLAQDYIVLKPVYSDKHPSLEETCISVYPGRDYDNGELENVHCCRIPDSDTGTDSDDTPDVVGTVQSHRNSV